MTEVTAQPLKAMLFKHRDELSEPSSPYWRMKEKQIAQIPVIFMLKDFQPKDINSS